MTFSSNRPGFVAALHTTTGVLATGNTDRDGSSGTVVDLFTGAANGSRIDKVTITAVDTTTAGMIRLFLYDGTNLRLLKEIPVQGITPSASLEAWTYEWSRDDGLPLVQLDLSTYKLRGATHNSETFHVVVEGGDF